MTTRTVTLTFPAQVTLDDEALTAALVAAPAGQIPEVPPGEYRWSTLGSYLVEMDVEVYASSPGLCVLESAGYGTDELPLPLQSTLSTEDTIGHLGSVNVGRIDTLTVDGSQVQASGWVSVGAEDEDAGRAAVLAIALGNARGISVDARMPGYRTEGVTDETGQMVDMRFVITEWYIQGATLTPFPAFPGAQVTVEGVDTVQAFDEQAEVDDMPAEDVPAEDDDMPMAASGIRSGFAIAAPKVSEAARRAIAEAVASVAEPTVEEMGDPVPVFAIRAAAGFTKGDSAGPPSEWFANPNLSRPTPLTIEADGRVYGHLAPWDSPGSKACHVGFADRCVCAPKSPDGQYPYMATGTVVCADGSKANVATIAFLGGHVADDGTQSWTSIKAAYDDPANSGLQVALGEDRHGIWMAGRVAPNRTAQDVEIMRACGVSGHWRNRLQGDRARGPRLIGACCVISEGFPKPVLTAAVGDADLPPAASGPVAVYDEDDELVSLVAANGTAALAAEHAPVSRAEFNALRDQIAPLLAAEAERVRLDALAVIDPQVKAAAQASLG